VWQLSLVMANLARVRPHALVYDPYCGTASTLVAAAAFGARVIGCDLHRPVLAGEVRVVSGRRAKQRTGPLGITATFDDYGLPQPLGLMHADSTGRLPFLRPQASGYFDAIVSDPPYGIRERPAVLDPHGTAHRGKARRGTALSQPTILETSTTVPMASTAAEPVPVGHTTFSWLATTDPRCDRGAAPPAGHTAFSWGLMESHCHVEPSDATVSGEACASGTTAEQVSRLWSGDGSAPSSSRVLPTASPKTVNGGIESILVDLFATATHYLAPEARLVFLLPATVPFTPSLLPYHQGLELDGAYEQVMPSNWSRWCVVMRRRRNGEVPQQEQLGQLDLADSHQAAIVPVFDRSVVRPVGGRYGRARDDGDCEQVDA
jgi:tRNA G10  N-methylase Trm11